LYVKKSTEIGGKSLSIEVGKLATLSQGSCVVSLGETIVLAAVNAAKPRPGIDFFPMTVEYREKTYAAGKIPGGFFKREARPTTKEVLGCRMIARGTSDDQGSPWLPHDRPPRTSALRGRLSG